MLKLAEFPAVAVDDNWFFAKQGTCHSLNALALGLIHLPGCFLYNLSVRLCIRHGQNDYSEDTFEDTLLTFFVNHLSLLNFASSIEFAS